MYFIIVLVKDEYNQYWNIFIFFFDLKKKLKYFFSFLKVIQVLDIVFIVFSGCLFLFEGG